MIQRNRGIENLIQDHDVAITGLHGAVGQAVGSAAAKLRQWGGAFGAFPIDFTFTVLKRNSLVLIQWCPTMFNNGANSISATIWADLYVDGLYQDTTYIDAYNIPSDDGTAIRQRPYHALPAALTPVSNLAPGEHTAQITTDSTFGVADANSYHRYSTIEVPDPAKLKIDP